MLKLTVPAPIIDRVLPVETNPAALKAWLVSLPPSNVTETGRAIFDALTTLNRVRLDAEQRLKLLKHYQVSIDLLDAPLEALFTSASLPAKEKAKQAATLARNLQLELANGYKLALNEKLASRFPLAQRGMPALVHRLMTVYQQLYWICCKNYMPLPEGVWRETHMLFRHAIQQKWIDAPEGQPPGQTIGGIYKQMLLLALADPYRYHPAELDKIQDLIRNYGAAAQFQPMSAAHHPAGLFLVRLNSDLPPVFLGQKPADADGSNAILLDTIDMARHLHKALQAVEQKLPTAADRNKAEAWLELLQRVMRQWSITPKRVFQRLRANHSVELCGGLRMTAAYFNGGMQTQPVLPEPEPEMQRITAEGPTTVSSLQTYGEPDRWVVLNESPGGYAVRMQPVPQQCVYRVGDIIGMRGGGADAWMVGAVRWLQVVDEGEAIEMGVQILAPTAEAAMVRPTIAAPGTTFQPALCLPELPVLKQPALLVGPRGSFGVQRELFLYRGETHHVIRATRLVEHAIGFDLFEYTDA
jgi:hypothetical protein